MNQHTTPKHPITTTEAQLRSMLREFINWNPELHYNRASSTGDYDDGPYIEADHFLALQHSARTLIGTK